jgi:hypothetical protein
LGGTLVQGAARLLARSWYIWAPVIVLVCLARAALSRRRYPKGRTSAFSDSMANPQQ